MSASWTDDDIGNALLLFDNDVKTLAKRSLDGGRQRASKFHRLALAVLLHSRVESSESSLTLDELVTRSPLANHGLLAEKKRIAALKSAMARLFLKEPVVCIVKDGNCKKYYSNQIWARYKAPEMDDLDAHAGFGNYLSGANVLRTKVSRIVENLGASLASSPQIFDADLESLRSVLENKKMELHNDLKGRTIALLGDTGTGKSWIINLLMMMSLVDRFTYAASNKGLAEGKTVDDMNALKDLEDGSPSKDGDEVSESDITYMSEEDLRKAIKNDEAETRDEFGAIKDTLKGILIDKDQFKAFLLPSSNAVDRTTTANTELVYGTRVKLRVEYHPKSYVRNVARMYVDGTDANSESINKLRYEALFEPLEEGQVVSAEEHKLRDEIRPLLGKGEIYVGGGEDLSADRRWIRDHLYRLMGHGPEETQSLYKRRSAAIKRIVIYLPSRLLEGGGRIIDPPGTNDRDSLNKTRLTEALNEAATVLVISRNDLATGTCIEKLSEKDCNFLRKLRKRKSMCSLIAMHYREKEEKCDMELFLRDRKRAEAEKCSATMEKSSRTGIASVIRSYLDNKTDEGEITEEQAETAEATMMSRVSILTAYPTLFASLLLNRDDAIKEIRAENESADAAACETVYAAALDFTRGYELLGFLEKLGLEHCTKIAENIIKKVKQSLSAVANQNIPPPSLNGVVPSQIVSDEDIEIFHYNALRPLKKLVKSLMSTFVLDEMVTAAEKHIRDNKAVIEQLPLRSINPELQGRSLGGKGSFSLREALFKGAPIDTLFEEFCKLLNDYLESLFQQLAFSVTDALGKFISDKDEGAKQWLENHAMPRAVRFLESQKDRFNATRKCYFDREEWFQRQFDDVVTDAIREQFDGLYESLLASEGEGAAQPASKKRRTSLGGSGRAARKVPQLGNAGYIGLLELIRPILKNTLKQFKVTMLDNLEASASALLRHFKPPSSPNPSCQLALIFKIVRLITRETSTVADEQALLNVSLTSSIEQIRKILEGDPDVADLGKDVACDIYRVAVLEDLFACCNFSRVNGELQSNLSKKMGIRVQFRHQKPSENPLQLSGEVLKSIRSGEEGTLQRRLRQTLTLQGLSRFNVPEDGDCFFHSMGVYIWGDTDVLKARLLRAVLCQDIMRNNSTGEKRQAFLNRYNQTVGDYVRRMSQEGCWADEIAIENFTHLVQRPIFVFQVGQDLPYIFGEDYSSRDPLVIVHVNSRGDGRDVHHHFVSVRNRDANDKNTPDFEVVKNGPDPKFAPPVPVLREGEVRGGRLIVVLDTNSIQHVPNLEDFETLYDVIVKSRLQDRVKIMVPVAVLEELNRQKQSGDDGLRRRARRFFTFKVEKPKYRKVFKNQNQVMVGAVDISIINLCRTAYYRTLPDRNDRSDGRIQGAVEHLMMMGDHVILFSDDSTIIDGCRSMVPDTADIGRLRESPSFYPRGQLRVVVRKHFIDIIDGLKMGDVPKGRTDTTVTKAQRQTLRDLRDGRAQLTIEVLLSLFNP